MKKDKKMNLQQIKEKMLNKMNQSQVKGGLGVQENALIAGCCTQGCCDPGLNPLLPIVYPTPIRPIGPIFPIDPIFPGPIGW